jgi:pyruvate kinase
VEPSRFSAGATVTSLGRHTKIVATIGPATSSDERIEGLLRAGVDVVRLNFSHGTPAQHAENIGRVRAAALDLGRTVAFLQDLQGPKIRTGALEGGRPVLLSSGSEVLISTRETVGNASLISTTYEALPSDVKPGDRVLLDDGRLRLRVLSTAQEAVRARVEHGGPLGEHKGINLPGVAVSAPALTTKDKTDIEFGLAQGVDYVALSFVREAEEIRAARRFLRSLGARLPLIAKLEKPQAIQKLDSILAASDGVMVARGDLGVELPPEQVPMIQKTVIRTANRLGKPVITATQMLESMVTQPAPTRAEATDVANAVWDGTDAVMLSAETAIGEHPIEAIQVMGRIVAEAEKQPPRVERYAGRITHAHAISYAARSLADDLDVQAIACFTRTGRTAQLLAQNRPRVPVFAFALDAAVQRRLALWWGVRPLLCPPAENTDALIAYMQRALLERGLVKTDGNLVIVGAIPVGSPTNFLKLHRVR